jgi:PIN domain nuclease of toxin-antitoxin system
MILLDTNAVIWLDRAHRRARPLIGLAESLAVSPATVLELQFLADIGRIRLPAAGVQVIVEDDRWIVDDPPSVDWFSRAAEEAWTRDPFDRLILAHARLRRCRLATSDGALLERLRPSERVAL